METITVSDEMVAGYLAGSYTQYLRHLVGEPSPERVQRYVNSVWGHPYLWEEARAGLTMALTEVLAP